MVGVVFERFTDRARRAVVLAQEEARMLNHNYIGTEHILLGLIREGDGVAARVLASLDISLAAVRRQVEEVVGKGQAAQSGHIPFTPRAKKVLELSLREALQLGHNYIGTEHILLGLIREGEGVAAQVLQKLGVSLQGARREVVQMLSTMGVEAAAVGDAPSGGLAAEVDERLQFREGEYQRIEMPESPPICPRCRTPLASSLRVRSMAAEGDGEASTDVRIVFCGTCGAALGIA
jgi:ATP-dependent Clp protease ATP-binding subunit ClpA